MLLLVVKFDSLLLIQFLAGCRIVVYTDVGLLPVKGNSQLKFSRELIRLV